MKQLVRRFGTGFGLMILGGLLAAGSTTAYAEGRATDAGPAVEATFRTEPLSQTEDWGITTNITHIIPAYDMQARDGSVLTFTGYNRYSATGQEAEAPIRLLSGSLIQSIELQGCDTSTTDEVVFILFRVNSAGAFSLLSSLGTTGTTAAPGCGFFLQAATSPHTVDAFNYTYYVAVRTGTTSATSFTAARVYYKLQVSPAPGSASFPNDVPTSHPFFRFVEALAASGITGGCGTGAFCPDTPVTRGQLAVFLASALGLHFPN